MKKIVSLMLVFVLMFAVGSVSAAENTYFSGMYVDFADGDLGSFTSATANSIGTRADLGYPCMYTIYDDTAAEIISGVKMSASNESVRTSGNFKIEFDVRGRNKTTPYTLYAKYIFDVDGAETETGWRRMSTAMAGSRTDSVVVDSVGTVENTGTTVRSGGTPDDTSDFIAAKWSHIEICYDLENRKIEFFVRGEEAQYIDGSGNAVTVDGVDCKASGYIPLPDNFVGISAIAFGGTTNSSSSGTSGKEGNGFISNFKILSDSVVADNISNFEGDALAVKYDNTILNLDGNASAKVYADGTELSTGYKFENGALWLSGSALQEGDHTLLIHDGTSYVAEVAQSVAANEINYDYTKGKLVGNWYTTGSGLKFEDNTTPMPYAGYSASNDTYVIWEDLPIGLYDIQFYNYKHSSNANNYHVFVADGAVENHTYYSHKADTPSAAWESVGTYRLSDDNSVKITIFDGTLRAHSIKLINESKDLMVFNYGLFDADGEKVTLDTAGASAVAKFSVHNASDESQTVDVLAASYKNGALYDVSKTQVTVPSGDYADGSIDISCLKDGIPADEVKFFVWESVDNIVPLDMIASIK